MSATDAVDNNDYHLGTLLSSSSMLDSEIKEREMDRRQSGLADDAFDEGLYITGISILSRLKSPKNAPSP
jgi:hypothetical protein